MSARNPPGISLQLLEGDGLVFLGANNLTLFNQIHSTRFFGQLLDGGLAGGTGGSLTLADTLARTFTLTQASTYTGGTTVEFGYLAVQNTRGSATGTGPVQVNGGILGGNGIISGPVTIGPANGIDGFLWPSIHRTTPRTLTIQATIEFDADSEYEWRFDSEAITGDGVTANGVTIDSGNSSFVAVPFDFTHNLSLGTIFTVINNTSATPIAGTFNNLADGSVYHASNGDNFQADYQGGDGNDLTLTVVP